MIINAKDNNDNTTTVVFRDDFVDEIKEMKINLSFNDFVEQYNNWMDNGIVIQKAFPTLSADEREFLMTGLTPTEWDDLIK